MQEISNASPIVGAPVGVQWINLPQHRDERGVLNVAEFTGLPFTPQRTFWVTSIPEGAERGGHAHRTTQELFAAVSGCCKVELQDADRKVSVQVADASKLLHIPAMVWTRLYDFSPDFVGVCLASEPYLSEGYFHDLESFRAACESAQVMSD